MDDESDWRKQLLVGLGVLVVVALLVGGIVGVIAIKAADVAGIGTTPAPDTGIVFPTNSDTTTPPSTSDQTPSSEPTTPTGSTPPTTTAQEHSGIHLDASPSQAGTYQRVNLTGTYQAPPGTSLQVQRREGASWVDFPTSAQVSGGQFSTYIETGRPGANRFRVVDAGSGKTSNIVTVQIS
jgi:cytoskeletal protein RodZ